jgi:hypothetical protein
MLVSELMASGMAAQLAKKVGLEAASTGLTATGTTQAGALSLVSSFAIFSTVGSGAGAILGAFDAFVYNGGSNALSLYPPVGGNINGGTTNAAISIPASKGAIAFQNGTTFGVIVSA